MWKLAAAALLVPAYAMSGQGNQVQTAPVKTEFTELATLSNLNSLNEMDMVQARALRNHAVSMQTYAMVAAR